MVSRTCMWLRRKLCVFGQVYDEYDEEVAAVEAAEEAANSGQVLEDKDAEIKPFLPK